MMGRVLPDEIDDWHLGTLRIVQVRDAIAEAGAEVKQRASGFLRHTRVAVGGSRCYALEEAEHAPYLADLVKRADDVYF